MITGAVANLLLNVLIVVLLALTISYCWILNRRIKILQDSRSELALLLKHFDESTQRASESIIALQTASKKIGENIQFRIDKANYLMDDLAFMIDKGNKLANQMEAGFAVSRARNKVMEEQKEEAPPESREPVFVAEPVAKPVEKGGTQKEKTTASLEAVLERVVGRGKPAAEAPLDPVPPPSSRERTQASRARSKAEQELLDMIKAGMKG